MTDLGSMACQDFVELVTDYLEGGMDEVTRARFEQHLALCPPCTLYLQQIRDARDALGRIGLDTLSDGARDQLLTAFRSWRADRADGPS